MNRPPQIEAKLPDEPTQRAWEEMRIEVLHELQDGGEVSFVRLDAIGEMLAKFPYTVAARMAPMPRPVVV